MLLLSGRAALAQGWKNQVPSLTWNRWDLSPGVLLPLALIIAIYIVGAVRRSNRSLRRHVFFAAGIGAVFLALQSPIGSVGEHLFVIHQIENFLLRIVGPMFLALALPQAVLMSGSRRLLRRNVLKRPLADETFRRILAVLVHPVSATALFLGTLLFWEIPRFHHMVVSDPHFDIAMHLSMLVSGLLFWWRIFDSRPEPKGLRYGVRLMMLWLAMLSSIALGSFTTLKQTVLYRGYDLRGPLSGLSAITDEQLGGLVIWIPSALTCLLSVILVIHAMGLHEEKLERRRTTWTSSNWAAMAYPATGQALVAQARQKNRTMAISFALFAAMIFAVAVLFGVFSLEFGGNRDAAWDSAKPVVFRITADGPSA